jgi:hypothetical protein
VAHVLDPAADGDVMDAGGDEGGREVDGLLCRAALAVDGRGGSLDRSPASSQALRAMLMPCSPNCCTQPATTSSTSDGSMPVLSITAP